MDDKRPEEIIIVRRRRDAFGDEPKNSVWKIAYADFMTAMMAFFLVMWLINATDQETREIVATYFNPIKLAEATTDRKGLRDPDSSSSGSSPEDSSEEAPRRGEPGEQGSLRGDAPRYSEAALFQDPYAILAEIAASADERPSPPSAAIDLSPGAVGEPGLSGGDAFRDPFDPVYWQIAPQPRVGRSDGDGTGGPVGLTDAGAAFPELGPGSGPAGSDDAAIPYPPGVEGDVASSEPKPEADVATDRGTRTETDAADENEAQALAGEIREQVGREAPVAAAGPALDVRATSEGVLISLTDAANFGMFAIGSAEPRPEVVNLLQSVGRVLSERDGRIVIRGHTDARPFRSADYDNWRLSTARAHMASYMLVRGGLEEGRIARVEGHADRMLKAPSEPEAAENRRIEILILEGPA